jgi:hypothetical protein
VRGVIYFAPRTPTANSNGARLRVHFGVPQSRKIDHQTIVTNAHSRRTVTTSANGYEQIMIASKSDCRHDIGRVGASHDKTRMLIECTIPNFLLRPIGLFHHLMEGKGASVASPVVVSVFQQWLKIQRRIHGDNNRRRNDEGGTDF